MTAEAKFDLLAMADSDIRVTPQFLATVTAEFDQDQNLAVTTCPYRAIAGPSIWSQLEALMMNTEFIAGILVARLLEGMKFAVGPTIVARKSAIAAIGGWPRLKDYLAEDFVLGRPRRERPRRRPIQLRDRHRIGSQSFVPNARHRSAGAVLRAAPVPAVMPASFSPTRCRSCFAFAVGRCSPRPCGSGPK
jgi:ceramide glucosyltransferase